MQVLVLIASLFLSVLQAVPVRAAEHGGGHGEPPPPAAHGEASGEAAESTQPKKMKGPAYTKTGMEKCVRPPLPPAETLGCGTREYDHYVTSVDTYNECIKPIEHLVMLSLEPCKDPRIARSQARAKARAQAKENAKHSKKRRPKAHFLDAPKS